VSALNKGAGVALANKKPLTVSLDLWKQMTTPANRQRLKYESTVGAGTPMVASLNRFINSGDTINKIQGTFSGTLGYLMTGLQEGKPYSAVVQEAFDLGFTEPDPRDDLGGVDVGRKALIVARSLGWDLEMSDVKIEPLYPDSIASLPIPEFMKALPTLDAEYTAKGKAAAEDNKVLRYVATIEKGSCTVGLTALPMDSPIGRLVGSENMMEYYTSVYGEKPVVVQGAGAGEYTRIYAYAHAYVPIILPLMLILPCRTPASHIYLSLMLHLMPLGGDVTAAGVLADMVDLSGLLTPSKL
jgi:homoserine dehydrogenase